MRVDGGFPFGASGRGSALVEKIDHVIVPLSELGLDEIAEELGIAAMPVDDDDLVEAVPPDLVGGGPLREQVENLE